MPIKDPVRKREQVRRCLLGAQADAISHYGGECAWCHKVDARMLCIDHVGGGGRQARQSGEEPRGGYCLAIRLRKLGWPEGFRILCRNCNQKDHILRVRLNLVEVGRAGYKRLRRFRLKEKTLDAYGGPACTLCGEGDVDVLVIDHVDGGGNAHRKAIGVKSGAPFYQWLQDNHFPPGYRVLCHNCNHLTGS